MKLKKIKEIPSFYNFVLDRIVEDKVMDHRPAQLLVNEYEAG